MIGINRGAFRVSEVILAQHETAIAQAVSKILMQQECEPEELVTSVSTLRTLGTFAITAIYTKGIYHSYVRTWAPLEETQDIKTEWVREPHEWFTETLENVMQGE